MEISSLVIRASKSILSKNIHSLRDIVENLEYYYNLQRIGE